MRVVFWSCSGIFNHSCAERQKGCVKHVKDPQDLPSPNPCSQVAHQCLTAEVEYLQSQEKDLTYLALAYRWEGKLCERKNAQFPSCLNIFSDQHFVARLLFPNSGSPCPAMACKFLPPGPGHARKRGLVKTFFAHPVLLLMSSTVGKQGSRWRLRRFAAE